MVYYVISEVADDVPKLNAESDKNDITRWGDTADAEVDGKLNGFVGTPVSPTPTLLKYASHNRIKASFYLEREGDIDRYNAFLKASNANVDAYKTTITDNNLESGSLVVVESSRLTSPIDESD